MDTGLPFTGRKRYRTGPARRRSPARPRQVKPRIVGINRKGKRKWLVFSSSRTAEFSTWDDALNHGNWLASRS